MPLTQEINLRPPTGSISATVKPATPRPGQQFTVTIAGATEAPRAAYGRIRPAGTACAPTHDTDNGDNLLGGEGVDGAFSLPTTTSQLAAGSYIVCLWLTGATSDTVPIVGPAVPVSIVKPPRLPWRCTATSREPAAHAQGRAQPPAESTLPRGRDPAQAEPPRPQGQGHPTRSATRYDVAQRSVREGGGLQWASLEGTRSRTAREPDAPLAPPVGASPKWRDGSLLTRLRWPCEARGRPWHEEPSFVRLPSVAAPNCRASVPEGLRALGNRVGARWLPAASWGLRSRNGGSDWWVRG